MTKDPFSRLLDRYGIRSGAWGDATEHVIDTGKRGGDEDDEMKDHFCPAQEYDCERGEC